MTTAAPDARGEGAACDACLARPWLLARLGGHLERERHRIGELLALSDVELVEAVGGREAERIVAELGTFDPGEARRAACRAGLEVLCRCSPGYPDGLRELDAPPAVLHVAGRLAPGWTSDGDLVAVVGTRRPSSYGREVARALGRGLAASGVGVISGLAFGVDAAAHEGASEVGGPALAVLPGGADRAYPAAHRRLRDRVLGCGILVSELAPGQRPWRWAFTARNRIIAGLAAVTVVVEAGERSGALVTAECAAGLGRTVAAVPGQVTLPSALGSNGLLARGAAFVRGAQDVLDLLGPGRVAATRDLRIPPTPASRAVLDRIAAGIDTPTRLSGDEASPAAVMTVLAELELDGWVRRGPGGRYTVVP